MRKWIILSLILLSLIISGLIGCKTIEYIYPDYVLPPEPTREIIQTPETLQDLAMIINYYDSLVSKWEQWAIDIEKILNLK